MPMRHRNKFSAIVGERSETKDVLQHSKITQKLTQIHLFLQNDTFSQQNIAIFNIKLFIIINYIKSIK